MLHFHFHPEAFEFLFTFCHKGGVICLSEVIDISPRNLDSSLCFIQPGISHNVLRYADDTTLMAESEELKSLLMQVKEENKKVGLKLSI